MKLLGPEGNLSAAPVEYDLEETIPLNEEPCTVPVSRWSDKFPRNVGILLEPSEEIEQLGPVVHGAPFIVLRFGAFKDGRPYSQARLLRARLRYKGQLIARGPLIPDQFTFLRRCGFDAVEISDDADLKVWMNAVRRYRVYLQPAVGDRSPAL